MKPSSTIIINALLIDLIHPAASRTHWVSQYLSGSSSLPAPGATCHHCFTYPDIQRAKHWQSSLRHHEDTKLPFVQFVHVTWQRQSESSSELLWRRLSVMAYQWTALYRQLMKQSFWTGEVLLSISKGAVERTSGQGTQELKKAKQIQVQCTPSACIRRSWYCCCLQCTY